MRPVVCSAFARLDGLLGVTTIQLVDVADPPNPPPPLDARVAVLVIAILVIGGGILAALAGPETPVVPDDTEPAPIAEVPAVERQLP